MTARSGKSVTGADITSPPHIEHPQPVDRINIALIAKAAEDLQHLQERTSLSKTDIVNRAITLYEFIEAQLRAGRDVLIRDSRTRETHTVLIL